VEYCNGGSDTQWGGLRARRGHGAPYNVKYWFVGNELYMFGRGLARGAEGCAAQSRLFSQAMKNADPSIRLVACTNFVPFISTPGWNEALLPAGRGMFDCCSVHDYVLGHVSLKSDDDMGPVARAPTQKILGVLQAARRSVDGETGKATPLGIVFDEWNINWGLTGSVCMGLYVAGFLNLLCREAGRLGIEMANFFQPITEGAIKVTPLAASLDSAGLVFDLFKAHRGNRLLELPGLPAAGDLDACASVTPGLTEVWVTLVNRSVDAEHVVELDFKNAGRPVEPSAKLLVARDVTREQSIFDERTETLAVAGGRRVSVRLPRFSIVRVHAGVACHNPSASPAAAGAAGLPVAGL
jgi:alpha-N-arabinofuranosidase